MDQPTNIYIIFAVSGVTAVRSDHGIMSDISDIGAQWVNVFKTKASKITCNVAHWLSDVLIIIIISSSISLNLNTQKSLQTGFILEL